MSTSKVLVTGAGGFIGMAVIQELRRRGCEVVYFDVIEPRIEGIKRVNRGTILDPYDLAKAVQGCDFAVHLAALVGVQKTEANKLDCLHINITGTLNFIEACIKEGVRKMVFSSSSEVYGEQDVHPIPEEAPLNALSVYAISKLAGEQYFRAYAERYGIGFNIVRLFNVYGEYQNDHFVMSKFMGNAVNGAPLRIYGSGEQVRSFCYVEDAARGLAEALFDGRNGDVYNIGNDREPITINKLAEKVIALSGKPLQILRIPYDRSDRDRTRDIKKRIPSIAKARRELNYEPRVALDQGLERILAFYREKGQ